MRTARRWMLAAALAAAGCGGGDGGTEDPGAVPSPPPATAPRIPAVPGGPGGLPPGHPPTGASHPFGSPEGWQAEKPSSAMRAVQFRLPRADGDAEDGEVAVFRGSMGGTAANIDRWRGQFSEVVHGKDTLEELTEGLKGRVTLLDITGTYDAGSMPGMAGGGGKAPGTRMIAAILEVPGGPYYVKATGPEGTVGKWEASIRSFILDAAR